jgi:hypothetical protein
MRRAKTFLRDDYSKEEFIKILEDSMSRAPRICYPPCTEQQKKWLINIKIGDIVHVVEYARHDYDGIAGLPDEICEREHVYYNAAANIDSNLEVQYGEVIEISRDGFTLNNLRGHEDEDYIYHELGGERFTYITLVKEIDHVEKCDIPPCDISSYDTSDEKKLLKTLMGEKSLGKIMKVLKAYCFSKSGSKVKEEFIRLKKDNPGFIKWLIDKKEEDNESQAHEN